ncbi:hypothetical protein T484DRAFT_1956658, partial [Baffinella frigidus]
MAHIAGAVMGSRRHGGYRGSLFSPAKALHGDDDGPPKCMVALFALAGVGLLFTGVTYGYDSFWNPRSLAIRPYNKAVDTWNGGERQYLQESEFYFRAYSPRAVTVTVPAVTCKKGDTECTPVPAHEETTYKEVEPTDAYADTVPWLPFAGVVKNDSLAHDQINTDLKDYTPLHYEAHGMLPAQVPGEWDDVNNEWTGPAYKFQIRAVYKGTESILALQSAVIFKDQPVGANAKMCRLHHGNNFHSGRCWERLAFQGACLQLAFADGKWSSPTWTGPDGHLKTQLGYLQAGVMTGGKYSFGYTPHEMWVQGMIMIGIGAFLMIPVIPTVCIFCSRRRASYNSKMRDDAWLNVNAANSRAQSGQSVSSSRSA